MIDVRYTCDRCKATINDLPPVILERVSGGLGHSQVPANGWHFHYNCFHGVVAAINRLCDGEAGTAKQVKEKSK